MGFDIGIMFSGELYKNQFCKISRFFPDKGQ